MKLSCTKENLQSGLAVVGRVASKNMTLPILGNILLRAEKGVLHLSATNLEVGVTARVRAKVSRDGTLTVQARLLTEFVSLLEHEKIDLDAEGATLHVASASSKTTIRGIPADDFPIIPGVPREDGIKLSAPAFREALSQVLFAAAQDVARPEISGIYLAVAEGQLTLAATDSYRLAERTMKIEDGTTAMKTTIVPARALNELVRILPDEGSVEAHFSESQALFLVDSAELTTRLIEGQYPDYKQIIPRSSTSEARVDIEPFSKLVRTASLFCKPGINDVTLEFLPEKKTIVCSAANAELGEHRGEISAPVQGAHNTVVFNYRYLLEGLANLKSASASIGVSDNVSPGVLRPEKSTGYLYIIMPIRQ